MMASSDLFGLEMLLKLECGNVTDKADMMMLFVHWFLVHNGFRNVGVGDDKTLDNLVEQSELLPEGWNANNKSYALRYTRKNELFILHGTLSNETMIFNLLHAKTLQVSNAAFNLDSTVGAFGDGKVTSVVNSIDEQIGRLQTELIGPLQEGGSKSSGTQTNTATATAERPVAAAPPLSRPFLMGNVDDRPLGRLGQGDLDPLGRLGGGMLADPLRPPLGLRPGNFPIPPGARYDPMGPFPNRLPGARPNPDHLPPPGYDDMFM